MRIFRALALAGVAGSILTGCSSIATDGLPRCSGVERRPLNSDLWEWQQSPPAAAIAPSDAPPSPKALGFAEEQPASPIAESLLVAAVAPRWDIEASYRRCAEDAR
ncbi:hypothetical protein SAMN05216337_107115 [Bradyrhizobium brasilense]|uniref:Type IV secretion system protein VirB7 n=1 Tax=Bradyrhizobium brasilense TaxID=1419277 RepID=A0A1G7NKX5_9BRAD|nr:hypothetical protein SAMN05216337_107115 [Bradyrhizobium brasilense]